MSELYENLFKIILIGDYGVGKSNLIFRVTQDSFYPDIKTTIGVEFTQKIIEVYKKQTILQIWDTAGQDRYKAITSAYYRAAVGAVLVYDVSRRSSFENLDIWVKEIQNNTSLNIVVMLLGNKIDLGANREVSFEEGKAYAKRHRFLFMEVSALSGSNVAKAFENTVKRIYKVKGENGDGIRPGSKLSFTEDTEQSGYFQKGKGRICC